MEVRCDWNAPVYFGALTAQHTVVNEEDIISEMKAHSWMQARNSSIKTDF